MKTMLYMLCMKLVTTRILQKDVSENFEFSCIVMTSTLTSSEYELAAEYNFLLQLRNHNTLS